MRLADRSGLITLTFSTRGGGQANRDKTSDQSRFPNWMIKMGGSANVAKALRCRREKWITFKIAFFDLGTGIAKYSHEPGDAKL